MLEFAGAFFENFELGLGDSEHFYLRILDVIFLIIIIEEIRFFLPQINAYQLGDRALGWECALFLGLECDRIDRFIHIKVD